MKRPAPTGAGTWPTAAAVRVAHNRARQARGLSPLRTNEEHWLWWARCGYVNGVTEIAEFEQAVDDALHGRPVNFDGRPARDGDEVAVGQQHRPDPDLLARTPG